MTWLPLYINPEGLRVVVLGGGTVATRRALTFARAGAVVTVYSLEFTPELEEAAGHGLLELRRVDLSSASIENLVDSAVIVVIATSDREINEKALAAAKRAGKLVNYPPEGVRGNVIVPFRGETSYGLRVAVTSLGETGVGARRARDAIIEMLENDESIRAWYEAMREVKSVLKREVGDYKLRYRLYFDIERDPVFARLVEDGRIGDALERAREIIRGALQSKQRQG